MESTVSPPRIAARRWRIFAFACFIAVALYAVLGGLVLPFVGKRFLETRISDHIGRVVQVDQITFNPFTLKASLEGVRVLERDRKTTFASLVSLDVGGSLHSIVELAPVVDSVELRGLRVNLVREEANRYNLSDILGRLAQPAPSSDKARFSLSNIRLLDAQVDFDDRPTKARHRLSEINLAIPFVSTLPAHRRDFIQPAFAAKINGTPLAVEGETQPFDETLRSQVSVTIGSLELKRYLGYSPVPLPINLDSGVLDAQMSARFTQNGNGVPTIVLSGMAALRDAQVSAAQAPLARFARLEARIHEFDPIAGKGRVTMVRLEGAAAPDERWRLPHAEANDIRIDLAHRTIEIGDIGVKGGELALERSRNGALELPWREPPSGSGNPSPPWTVTVARLGVDDTSAVLVDRAVSPPATHRLAVAAQASDLTTRDGGKGAVKARLGIGKNGRAEIVSTFSLEPFAARAEIDANRIDLVALRPYAKQFPDVALLHGFASAKGRIVARTQGDGLSVSYAGAAEVTKLATVDTTRKEDLLNWESLVLKGIALEWSSRERLELAVSDVLLDKAYSRLIVHPDGKLNVQQLMTRDNGDPPPAAGDATPAPRVRIDRIRVAGSRLNFTDHFIRPNYTADVGDIDGTITGLSSDPESRGVIELAGRYDTASPVLIGGTVNPLRADLFADIRARGTDIDLPKLSAYSQRYAGYGITKGKLSLDVQYHIDAGKLEGRNKIALQQLTFGERVESPDATKLPVLFAASLLKDADGNIDIELPISGSLEDPQFNVGGLVAGMVGRLLSKAVTSPFSLLAAAFGGAEGKGGGEELSYVQFAPGNAEVAPAEEQKLGTLLKALRGRPGLTLEIAAHIDPATDSGALKRTAFDRRLRVARAAELAAGGKTAPDPDSLAIAPEEYPHLVRSAFVSEKLGAKDTDISVAAMEEALLERMTVSQEDLEALARSRAARVKEFLVDKGQLPEERLVVAAAADNTGPAASRVAFTLK